MNAQLSLLVQLQQFDLNIHQLDDQRHKIPARIDEARSALDQAISRLEDVKTALEKATTDRRSGEQDLDEQESHVQKLRTRLMELKTNKEYQAHLFEIDLANKKKDSLEERVLLAMERGEEKQKELEEVQGLVDDAIRSFTQEKTQLESKAIDFDRELEELKVQKEDVLKLLDKSVYARYTKLKSTLKVVVVAQVRSGACQGCQLQIPPQLIADVKRADQLLACPYCFRILYGEDFPSSVPEFSTAQEAADV